MGSNIAFKQRLQYLIDRKKINQVDLAKGIDVQESRVSDWLKGKPKNPHRKTIVKISDFFGCNPDWLQTGEGIPYRPSQIGIEGTTSSRERIVSSLITPYGDASPEEEREHCIKEMNSLFQLILKWQEDENGLDSRTSMNFIVEFHKTYPEFSEWLKKRKMSNYQDRFPENNKVNEK